MDVESALEMLKKEYPEIEEGILREALRNNDNDFKRASESIRARFYSEDAGIPQEQSLWSSVGGSFSTGEPSRPNNNSDWDLSLDSITEGMNALGTSLLLGVEAVADTLGSLGDLIPDLIFGADDEYYVDEEGNRQSKKDRDQVVVGASRSSAIKKRQTPGKPAAAPEPPAPVRVQHEVEYATDEETDDWTKED